MKNLKNKLKKYSLKDAIYFENQDRQFLALKKLSLSLQFSLPYREKEAAKISNFLFLIIANSLICYQLSGKGEDYWEEFSEFFENKTFKNFQEFFELFENFLAKTKNNKRFIETKLKRIKKLENFYNSKKDFENYYKNMKKLALDLSKIMNQKIEAKTIVFAVKMFSYWARNTFNYLEYFPENLMIPIDSRLEKLFEKYNNSSSNSKKNKQEIKTFYINLSKKLKIPLLHLDAILWLNYDDLIEKN